MPVISHALHFLILTVADWLQRRMEAQIERSKRISRRAFLRAHWGAIAATDFFCVEVLTLHGVVRYFVLFVIDRPNLNSYAERFVLSIKSECLNDVVPLGEGHMRTLVTEFVAHYPVERPHQSLGNEVLAPPKRCAVRDGIVRRRQRLGGMLNYYERAAA